MAELARGSVESYTLVPEELGLPLAEPQSIRGGDVQENARKALDVLSGEKGPARDVVLLNAAAALYVGEIVSDLKEGVEASAAAIDSGAALKKLEGLKELTNR